MPRHPLSRQLCRLEAGLRLEAGDRSYRLGRAIGNGAVGVVRKAIDLDSGATVAIKVLAPDPKYISQDSFDEVAERFRREGERGVGLRHDNLVQILAYEENVGGTCFNKGSPSNPLLVMEFVRGSTLEGLLQRTHATGRTEIRIDAQTLTIAVMLSRALLHLHERKIIHRDVKPANIFISSSAPGVIPGEVKLGDFGVTKWGDFLAAVTTGTLTMSSQVGLGTLKYMSPEQAVRPREVTVRSDIFSLGVTLYELFTGRILASPHHVFDIMVARNMRAALSGKLIALGLPQMTAFDEGIFDLVMNMFATASGRPTSKQLTPRFETWLERFQGHD